MAKEKSETCTPWNARRAAVSRGKAAARRALAVVLACGLMVPSVGLQAYGEEAVPAAAPTELATPDAGDGSVGQGENNGTGGGSNEEASGAEGAVTGSESVPAEGAEAEGADAPGDPAASAVPADDADKASAGDAPAAPAAAPASASAVPAAQSEEAVPVAADDYTDYNGLSIKGGQPGEDYALESVAYNRLGRGNNESAQKQNGREITLSGSANLNISSLVIKKSGTYTIKNTAGEGTAVATAIYVSPGIKADITLAGVNINAALPFNIATNSTQNADSTMTVEVEAEDVVNKTYVHLTLADGTTNRLYSSHFTATSQTDGNNQFPGLRCGEGSILVIDDAVRNVDTAGNAIVPEQGKIPAGVTYVNRDGETVTSTGAGKDLVSSLSNLESRNVGALQVYGGVRSAAIGGGPMENSGYITINGGEIHAEANDPRGDGSGCGIGGGHAGGGTKTTINGGHIVALGSLHGAGIGGGCTYTGGMSSSSKVTMPLRDALLSRHANHTIAGDITINGGFVESKGWQHSNAFGQGCQGSNAGKTILITGGTLLPSADPSQESGFYDIGGNQGYVIITGGSVFCGMRGGAYKFQGNDNDGKAYGDLAKTKKVGMLTVNVKSKIDASASVSGVTPDYNAKLESWELLIDKFATDPAYGAPSRLNDGKLYLWLPDGTNATQQIDANFSYYVGDKLLKSNTTLPSGSSSGGDTVAKEWEHFTLSDTFVKENWNKYYDGVALTKVDVAVTPIPVDNPEGGRLDNNDFIKYNFQQMKENGEAWGGAQTGTATPLDAGLYDIEVRSEQYKSNSAFAQTYWGHVATGRATILPITSKTSWELSEPVKIPTPTADGGVEDREYSEPTWMQDENAGNFNTATNNHLIVPVDVASDVLPFGDTYADGSNKAKTTCLAPTGYVQLYIDGRAVPEQLGGIIRFDRAKLEDKAFTRAWIKKDADGREHTMAYFNLTRGQLEAFGLEDRSGEGNEHEVHVQYSSARESALSREPLAAAAAALALPRPLTAASRAMNGPASYVQAGVGDVQPAYTDSSYVNYYESTTSASPVEIELATPDFRLFNQYGTGYVPNGEGLSDADQAANDAKLKLDGDHERDWVDPATNEVKGTEEQTDVSKFRDEVDDDGNVVKQQQDWFPLYVQTNSIGDIVFTSSNPGVIQIQPNGSLAGRDYVEGKTDYGIGAVAKVMSAGKTTITATIKGTGAYSSVTKSFDVYIFPDLAKKPELSLAGTSYVTDRNDGTVRPGDTVRYTLTAENKTQDSACINPVYELGIPSDSTFKGLVVLDPAGNEVPDVKYHIENGKVVVDSLPTLFGGQSYQFKMDVTVNSDGFDPATGAVDLKSTSKVSGIYGVNPDKFSWDDRIPAEGLPVEAQTTTVDPTLPDPNPADPKPIVPDPDAAKDILGGELIEEAPEPTDPDDPDSPTEPKKPGVPVGDVTPDSPFAEATEAHPDDPTRPADPTDPDDPDSTPKKPIQPGDRIVSFGDKENPETPDDIAKELDEQIKKKLEEDPDADHVDIPVTIERPNPDDPDGDPIRENVIVTVPITPDMKPDPDARDDHDVVVIPADVDPREDGDIVLSKSVENVTPGFGDRPNQGIALVGDTVRFTITAENTKPGSAWYDVIIKDPLPEGVAYVPGTAVVRDSAGKEYRNFAADYDAASRIIGFCLGDLYGVGTASVSFDCVVTPAAATGIDIPANKAYAFGTEPSTTVKPDPANPDGPVVTDRTPVPPGPYNPDDAGKTWDEVEKDAEDEIRDVLGVDPDEPLPAPVTPTTPIDEVFPGAPDPDKLVTTKTAENLSARDDKTVHVGDVIRYTVTLANNDGAHTMWYNVVLEDALPKGLNPVAGSMKLTLPDGTVMDCPDEAYAEKQGNISVFVGNVRGGESASLTFEAVVTPAALSSDIGNVGRAFGSPASDLPTPVLKGEDKGGMPDVGNRFDPGEGWDQFIRDNTEAGNAAASETSYPEGFDGTVRPADATDDNGNGARADGRRGLRLAQTGDELNRAALMLGALGLAALVAAVGARRRRGEA